MTVLKEIYSHSEWTSFVGDLKPNTFLHSWEWGKVQEETGEGLRHLGFYNDSQLVGVALLIIVNARRGRHYLVPHGPLLKSNLPAKDTLTALVNYAREHAKADGAVALRIAPLFETTPEMQQLFSELGFRSAPLHVHTELTWMLDITSDEETLLQRMRKTTRHAIRKANGVVDTDIVTDASALERFWPLYEQTKTRHAFVPFSKKFLQAEIDTFAANGKFFAVFAKHEGRDVAAALLIHEGDTVFYHHGASEKLPASVPAAHAVQWAAIQEAKRRGAKRYNFWGVAPAQRSPKGEVGLDPNHPFAGITVFKQGFGGHAIDYMHAQDLPLSFAYWRLWAVDRYRKLRRGF
jgi:lipid II:glycine glycyltransferase (peptidoglycan interpeptide bridge formation enzyme)